VKITFDPNLFAWLPIIESFFAQVFCFLQNRAVLSDGESAARIHLCFHFGKLQHKHVELVRGTNTYLRLTLPATKLHNTPVVTLRPAVQIYQQIVKHYQPMALCGLDDYLFLPAIKDRTYAQLIISVMFNWVLEHTGHKLNPNNKPRTLYSLRHSAITFRLLYGQGIDLITLARNARTSIEVINNHYASTVTGEQNIAMLQSRRGKR
jgi:hypothetical protein